VFGLYFGIGKSPAKQLFFFPPARRRCVGKGDAPNVICRYRLGNTRKETPPSFHREEAKSRG
jgi:hypothetical protein